MSQEFQRDNAVITDTSCFILLDKLDAFPILHALYQNVITTPEIASEFGKALPDWIEIKPVSNKKLQNTYLEKVDIGEASAIALAMELVSPLLIIDDLKGRKLALHLKLKFTGTLGVLILAKQRNIIPLLAPFFDKIKATDFRISAVLLKKILEELGE
jgi:predicted nucleic acid-binding protein